MRLNCPTVYRVPRLLQCRTRLARHWALMVGYRWSQGIGEGSMADQEQGFVIRDRRGTGAAESPSTSSSAQRPAGGPASQDSPSKETSGPPVTFSSFVISLGSSSLMLMGEQLDPQQQSMPVNLPQAKEIIDLLSVLEEKTKGNLTSEEQTVLRDMLYALRMKYITLASPK
jgi:hypothetical protein